MSKKIKLRARWCVQRLKQSGYWELYKTAQFRTPETANMVMVKAIFDGCEDTLRVVRKLYRSRAPAKPRCL